MSFWQTSGMFYRLGTIATRLSLPPWLVSSFLFWIAFLLVLELGNVARAIAAEFQLSLGAETVRIFGAALIGTASTPAVLYLLQRYKTAEHSKLGRILWMLFALIALAGILNIVSSFVAAWIFERQWLPEAADVRYQLIGNWALLTFALVCLTSFMATENNFSSLRSGDENRNGSDKPRRFVVQSGRETLQIDVAKIDWIEARGNYVALHVGRQTHLIRDTLTNFEKRLEKSHFVRAHRRIIVALNRIQRVRRADNGGAILLLDSGHKLVASRRYRKSVRDRWADLNRG